jgi:hypothetical protein
MLAMLTPESTRSLGTSRYRASCARDSDSGAVLMPVGRHQRPGAQNSSARRATPAATTTADKAWAGQRRDRPTRKRVARTRRSGHRRTVRLPPPRPRPRLRQPRARSAARPCLAWPRLAPSRAAAAHGVQPVAGASPPSARPRASARRPPPASVQCLAADLVQRLPDPASALGRVALGAARALPGRQRPSLEAAGSIPTRPSLCLSLWAQTSGQVAGMRVGTGRLGQRTGRPRASRRSRRCWSDPARERRERSARHPCAKAWDVRGGKEGPGHEAFGAWVVRSSLSCFPHPRIAHAARRQTPTHAHAACRHRYHRPPHRACAQRRPPSGIHLGFVLFSTFGRPFPALSRCARIACGQSCSGWRAATRRRARRATREGERRAIPAGARRAAQLGRQPRPGVWWGRGMGRGMGLEQRRRMGLGMGREG